MFPILAALANGAGLWTITFSLLNQGYWNDGLVWNDYTFWVD